MDDADRADDERENSLQFAIGKMKRDSKKNQQFAVGVCIWCDEPTTGKRLWCDIECRTDWENQCRR